MEKAFAEFTGNPVSAPLADIPVLDYPRFMSAVDHLVQPESAHCLAYFAVPGGDLFRFICCIGDDASGKIHILSHQQPRRPGLTLESITAKHHPFHVFEREIHEEHGVLFTGHPWLKPIRYPEARADRQDL